jgi:beta-fructofuranosidase
MVRWKKHPANPVIGGPPEGLKVVGFRDPCVWREDDIWYAIIGSGIEGVGGISLLYRSEDMVHWEYLHPFYEPDRTPGRGMHECPDFFPLDGKHVLLTSAVGTHWDVGTYEDHKFTPEKHGRIDWGSYYAAKTLLDDQGRRIIWGWIQEGRSQDEATAAGWSGVLSLPRILRVLSDGSLEIEPAPEVEPLRGKHWSYRDIKISGTELLDGVEGDCIEVIVKFAPGGAREFGIILQGSDRITYDSERGQLAGAPLTRSPDEELTLRVYVDRSVIEIFANGRIATTLRSYHKPDDDKGVRLFASGGSAIVESIDVWEMKAAPVKYFGGV